MCGWNAVLVALLMSTMKLCAAETDNPRVQTTSGLLTGTTFPESHAFFSIPYAVPPIGDKRFAPPEALSTPKKVVDATKYNSVRCAQILPLCVAESCYEKMKEDCLVISVFVPNWIDLSSPPTYRLPVMVWIHGGALQYGSGTHPLYDPRSLAKVTGNIVVNFNYRLGPFGFLVHGNTIKGNQGLKDQQLALKWVQNNIKNFGGDKNKVTLFGQSAGAQSISAHLVSSVSEPLFARAILQSFGPSHRTLDRSKKITEIILKAVNCSGVAELACLRKVPTHSFVTTYQQVVKQAVALGEGLASYQLYQLVIDGVDIKDNVLNLFRDGKWNKNKDLIIGGTSQEYEFSQYTLPWLNETSFKAFTNGVYGSTIGEKIATHYIQNFLPPSKDYRYLHGSIATHGMLICPARAMARFASESSHGNVYFYISAQSLQIKEFITSFGVNKNDSLAFHGSPLPFIFRSARMPSGRKFTKDERLVANAFSTYWGSFAKTGKVSSYLKRSLGRFTQWPLYSSPFWDKLIIEAPQPVISHTITDPYSDICDFWDDLNVYVKMPSDDGIIDELSELHDMLFALGFGDLLS